MTVKHKALSVSFAALLAGLRSEVVQGTVNETRFGNLSLFNYSKDCQFNHNWNLYTMVARGLILDVVNNTIVGLPFFKFFNSSEPEGVKAICFEGGFTATMKMDGSLGIIYHYDNDWHVATRGSFISPQACWAENYLHTREDILSELVPGNTYLAEIIYPENKIVIKYDFSDLVLLGGYENSTGRELDYFDEIVPLAIRAGWRFANSVPFSSLSEVAEVAKHLPGTQEGFVVRFNATGDRIKMKGDEYCTLHKMISRITPLGIWELMVKGYDMESYKKSMPEEFTDEISSIVQHFSSKATETLSRVQELYARYAGFSDKELGLAVNTGELRGVVHSGKLFPLRKRGVDTVKALIMQELRPTGNKIPGYVPSTNLLRAQTEE